MYDDDINGDYYYYNAEHDAKYAKWEFKILLHNVIKLFSISRTKCVCLDSNN